MCVWQDTVTSPCGALDWVNMHVRRPGSDEEEEEETLLNGEDRL